MKLKEFIVPAAVMLSAVSPVKAFASESDETDKCEYSATVAARTAFLTADGFQADDEVVQLSLDAECKDGWYGSVWGNKSLTGAPSDELNLIAGKVTNVIGGTLDTSVSYLDIKNPDLLDFDGDLIAPAARFEYDNLYIAGEAYLGDGDGWAFEGGVMEEVSVGPLDLAASTGLRHVEGPFQAPGFTYINSNIGVSTPNLPGLEVGLQVFTVIDKAADDTRGNAKALGVHYRIDF